MRSLRIAAMFVSLMPFGSATADISLDGTVGPREALQGPDYQIPHTLGTTKGANLFHSFETFNLRQGERATFTGPDSLKNVISRVTGGGSSTIDGELISRIGTADFWFINPAGVVFGPNARIDVPAAFHVSTADDVGFADGARFSALDTGGSILTTAAPEAFGFLNRPHAAIDVRGSELALSDGATLSLVGGDITIANSILYVGPGDIRLVALQNAGEVALRNGDIAVPDSMMKGDLRISASEVYADGGGRVLIRGGNLVMESNSVIIADTYGDDDRAGYSVDIATSGSADFFSASISSDAYGNGDAGDIRVDSGDRLSLHGSNVESLSLGHAEKTGNSGNIELRSRSLNIDSTYLSTFTATAGSGGDIKAHANTLKIEGNSGLDSSSYTSSPAAAPAGSIVLTAGDVLSIDGSQSDAGLEILARSEGSGNAGSIVLSAPNGHFNMKTAAIYTSPVSGGAGGDVSIDAGEIDISAGRLVTGADFSFEAGDPSPGAPGAISLTAVPMMGPDGTMTNGALTISGTEVLARAVDEGGGGIRLSGEQVLITDYSALYASTVGRAPAGTIEVAAGSLAIRNDSEIAARSAGSGRAGSINIEVGDQFLMHSGLLDSSPYGSGDGGDITVSARRMELSAGADISSGFNRDLLTSDNPPTGAAGTVDLTATETLRLRDSGITVDAWKKEGGEIRLTARDLSLLDSSITASTFGDAKAGDITINSDRLNISGGYGGIYALTSGAGSGGTVSLSVKGPLLLAEAGINAQTTGPGQGGDLHIDAGSIEMMPGGIISTEAYVPEGADEGAVDSLGAPGRIDIRVDGDFSISGSDIITTTGNATGSRLTIRSANLQVSKGALIDSSTYGPGKGGSITINTGTLSIAGAGTGLSTKGGVRPSSIASRTGGGGDGGEIFVNAENIDLSDGGQIVASSSGSGDAGSIYFEGLQQLTMRGSSVTTASQEAAGGQIDIRVDDLIHLKDSAITTSVASGTGNAGNIFIDPRFLVLENSRIVANAEAGRGGDITIRAGLIIRDPESVIDASSRLGISGTVSTTAPEADIESGILVTPPQLADPSSLLAETCPGRSGRPRSGLVRGGKGGLPADPSRPLSPTLFADRPTDTDGADGAGAWQGNAGRNLVAGALANDFASKGSNCLR